MYTLYIQHLLLLYYTHTLYVYIILYIEVCIVAEEVGGAVLLSPPIYSFSK
jgi:hypothetical protein